MNTLKEGTMGDELTNAQGKTIRNHDFRRTDLLERVSLQALQGLLEGFSRAASQKFTSTMRHPCVVEVTHLDQVTWRDLTEELSEGMFFFTFSLAPLASRAVLAMPTEEMLALVDLRLAGTGEDDFSGRVPTEIDQAFFSPIAEDIINELGRSLARIHATAPTLEAQEGSIQFVSVVSPAEMCMAIRLEIQVATRQARSAVICLPFPMVRTLISGLQLSTTHDRTGDEAGAVEALHQRIAEIPMDVVFQFPSFVTTPAQLMTLQVGDNLGLGHPKGRPLEVRVEGLLVALADIGSSGVHKACMIKEEVTK